MEANGVETLFNVRIGKDSQESIADVETDYLKKISKQANKKYQSVLGHVWKGDVWVECVPLEHMVANIMTKNLVMQKFLVFQDLVGVRQYQFVWEVVLKSNMRGDCTSNKDILI